MTVQAQGRKQSARSVKRTPLPPPRITSNSASAAKHVEKASFGSGSREGLKRGIWCEKAHEHVCVHVDVDVCQG